MNKHALIFGASGGIGRSLSTRLLDQGWQVTAVSRELSRLDILPESVHKIEADGCSESGVRDAFAGAEGVSAVANCIGNLYLKPVHMTPPAEFSSVMRIHLFSSYLILREAVQQMKGGHLVFLSSAAASAGLPNHEAIAAAKGAVESLVRSAAATYASKGFRINAVAPGLTETPMTEALCNSPARKISEGMHALGRLGQADDISSALAWFMDPEQSWVSGETLHVDGGLSRLRSNR